MMFVHPSPSTKIGKYQQNSPQEICCTGTRFQNGKITTNRKKTGVSTVLQDLFVIEEKVAFTLQNLKK
jgi:hypothetical protein